MKLPKALFVIASFALVSSCGNQATQTAESENDDQVIYDTVMVESAILTQEEQQSMTPDDVMELFRRGNERFTNNDLTARDHSAQIRKSVSG